MLFFIIIYICSVTGFTTVSGLTRGPADVVVKFTDKCHFTLPTFIDMNLRVWKQRNKQFVNVSAVLPFKLSDKIGVEFSIGQKKDGQWKPNFFNAKGPGVCRAIKLAVPEIFALIAKDLNVEEPYECPLPKGNFSVTHYTLNMRKFQSLLGVNSIAYGEFRAFMNITHQSEIVGCYVFFADSVPRQRSTKSG